MRRRLFIASAALLALSAAGLAQHPVTKPASPYGVVTQGAVDAFRRFALAQESARRVFDSAVSDASTRLLVELRVLQERLTRSGNLDEAVKLRSAIADLQQGKAPPPAKTEGGAVADTQPLARVLPGSVWKHGDGWTMTLAADQSATSSHQGQAGTWAVNGARSLRLSISMNNCAGQMLILSPDGTRLLSPEGGPRFVLIKKN